MQTTDLYLIWAAIVFFGSTAIAIRKGWVSSLFSGLTSMFFQRSPRDIAMKGISSEERLESIEHLLYKINRNVAFFAWVLSLTLVVGFFWVIENS